MRAGTVPDKLKMDEPFGIVMANDATPKGQSCSRRRIQRLPAFET